MVGNADVLGSWNSPQDVKWMNWSTGPRAYNAWWSVQSSGFQMDEIGRPVPKHIMLDGRYSPQVYHVYLTKDPAYLFLKKLYRRIKV